jgi:hypothetical protein
MKKIDGDILVTKDKGVFYNLFGIGPDLKTFIDYIVGKFMEQCDLLLPFKEVNLKQNYGKVELRVIETEYGWELTFYLDNSVEEET